MTWGFERTGQQAWGLLVALPRLVVLQNIKTAPVLRGVPLTVTGPKRGDEGVPKLPRALALAPVGPCATCRPGHLPSLPRPVE